MKINEKKKEKYLFSLLFLIIPFAFLGVYLLIAQKSPSQYQLVFNDEIDYWIETSSFIKRGLFDQSAGYFGYSWNSHASLLYFGAHGFFSLLPYAILGGILPWFQGSIVVINTLFISISLLCVYHLIGSAKKTFLALVLLFTFYPFYLYYHTGMTETMIYAGSLFLAALFFTLFDKAAEKNEKLPLFFWIVVIYSVIRMSNIVFFIPAFLIEIVLLKRNVLPLFMKYALAVAFILFVSLAFSASYPWGFLSQLAQSNAKINLMAVHGFENLKIFFDLQRGYVFEILPRLVYLTWLACLIIYLFINRKRLDRTKNLFFLSQIFILTGLLLINLMFYDIGSFRDLRVFSPFLFFSVLSTLFFQDTSVKKLIVFGIFIFVFLGLNVSVYKERNFIYELFYEGRFSPKASNSILKLVQYTPDAKTRWENTVYLDLRNYGTVNWENYEPGIGIMVVGAEGMDLFSSAETRPPAQAKYLITAKPFNNKTYELVHTEKGVSLYQKTSP